MLLSLIYRESLKIIVIIPHIIPPCSQTYTDMGGAGGGVITLISSDQEEREERREVIHRALIASYRGYNITPVCNLLT